MNNLYRFLRCTVMMAVMMTIPTVMTGALPDTTTVNGTHLYKINLAKNASASQYQSVYFITPSSPNVSIKDNPGTDELWYILETDDTPTGTFDSNRPHIEHYCYIVNAVSGQYLYYTGTNSNTVQTNVVEMKDINGNSVENDRFKFIIKKSGNGSTTNYCMYPKIAAENNKFSGTTNLWESNSSGYLALGVPHNTTYTNGLTLSKERNGEWSSQWNFVSSSLLTEPTITFNSETNTFSINHNALTSGCTIYYTTDNSTPTTSSTPYTAPVIVDASMTVKAVVTRDGYVLTEMASEEMEPVAVAAPTITNNYDGTITLSTTTTGATIYYTTNGDTPDNNSTEYENEPFSLDDATVIKAIAYVGEEYSGVTTYNVPKYTTPTISFDNNTSQITITSEGTVYYNTGDGSQDDPTPSSGTLYNAPFTVSSDITVKAIATHAGYLNSEVATWPTDPEHDYSLDYLTFNVLTEGTICWKAFGSVAKEISYSINNSSWESITAGNDVAISVNAGDVVRFKGLNSTYATDKNNYSGFDGGTATFDIEGNIMSLIYGDNFVGETTMSGTYNFCSLFKQSMCISAKNLILPATTLTNDCYRAMFSLCTTLETAPQLPATTLAKECYWYMFECCAITTAPDLLAPTLATSCYAHMFVGCSNLNYIKCMATSGISNSNLANWVGEKNAETTLGVAGTGTFVKDNDADWSALSGTSGIPSGWEVINFGAPKDPEINCDGESITITCATEGASIYYRLSQTDAFALYNNPIAFVETTTVEAYSFKDDYTSNHVIITFEKFANPFEESTRPVNSWTFGNTQVTLPCSVNGTDGHSSSYSKGTHAFETTITLYKQYPTYLWFQHADQSADIYVDNTYVTTHWGGYNAFFVDITNYVHVGTNRIKVILNNKTRNELAPAGGDFNFNATLGKVVLLTSPVMPSMDYGYDGFHITATNVSNTSATLSVKTKIPVGASVKCIISDGTYNWTETQASTGNVQTFTTTITGDDLVLWNGTINPHLYTVTLEIYKDDELYHSYQRPYGIRYYDYVFNENGYTGFRLNGSPYSLRGVCMHHDLEGKANALTDEDIANDFALIQELGCNFLRLAHYPHPKEVFDWCDRLGIIVQTEVPCVNKFQSTMPEDYYTHLVVQYDDMVRQHYNHPCIMFWGLGNEIVTDDASTAKTRLEGYRTQINALDPERWVGYVVSHSYSNPSSAFNNPDMDWFGCNIYVGWYIDKDTNNPTNQLNTRVANIITDRQKPLAFSEYGCGGTQHCHSDHTEITTTKGNYARHDIEYQMWLHEGHIAAIKNFPQLLFTSQWQLFDIAVSSRNEGYTECPDGLAFSTNDELRYLNNKGLVERDHVTKKDPFYLYKAWWNPTKFVHICGKDYKKITNRVIKCYTNCDGTLNLYLNGSCVATAEVVDNIATFEARDFAANDVIRVAGATRDDIFDTYTIPDGIVYDHIFQTDGNWNEAANWKNNSIPTAQDNVLIKADAIIPSGTVAHADVVFVDSEGSLTIDNGGQLDHNNEGTLATVKKAITARSTVNEVNKGWTFIASPVATNVSPNSVSNMTGTAFDLYRFNQSVDLEWENWKQSGNHYHFDLENGQGYLYNNVSTITLGFAGAINPCNTPVSVSIDFVAEAELAGWNLVGNPFTFNAIVDRPYYMMNEDGSAILATEQTSGTIAPCTGIMVHVSETEQSVTFSKEPLTTSPSNGNVSVAVVQANERGTSSTTLDKAIVSFNKGNELPKFCFGNTNAKLYIPQGDKEFAIACAEAQGELPLNFLANKNGQYTLTISTEGVDMAYLHLIDNMTGADVDLLAAKVPELVEGPTLNNVVSTGSTTSYTFTAKTTDYESRFKLVFSINNEDGPSTGSGTFAFYSNGNIIINGEGTVQLIDMTGRIIVSVDGHTRCIPTAGMTPGVYVLRLIDGNDVKTQKIVVR